MIDRTDRLVLNPVDYSALVQQLRENYSQPPTPTLFGVPVSTSDAVPVGQVLRVRPRPVEPIAFQGFDPAGAAADRTVWLRYGMGLSPLKFPSVAITLCEGGNPIKRLTKAQRRRNAKRFIREEVARRRMERCR